MIQLASQKKFHGFEFDYHRKLQQLTMWRQFRELTPSLLIVRPW